MTESTRYQQWTLRNGLQVLHAFRPWNRTFASSLVFNAGWCDESNKQLGLTHLVEHLTFTAENESLVESLSQRGLNLNGVTEWEQTHFFALGHTDLFEPLLEFYANVLRGVTVARESLDAELQIIGQEYANMGETPFELEMRRVTAELLGDANLGQPLPTSVKNLSREAVEDVQQFIHQRFAPSNGMLTIVSPTDPEQLRALLGSALGQISDRPGFERSPVDPDLVGDDRLTTRFYPTPQLLLTTSFAWKPKDRFPLGSVSMLSELLGGGHHSLLFQSMRRDAQLSYHHGTNMTTLNNAVILQLFAVVHRRQAVEAMSRLVDVIAQMRDKAIPDETLELGKTRMLHSLDALEDDSSSLCDWLCHQPDPSEPDQLVTPETFRRQVASITPEGFRNVAREALSSKLRSTCVLGGIRFLRKRRIRNVLSQNEQP